MNVLPQLKPLSTLALASIHPPGLAAATSSERDAGATQLLQFVWDSAETFGWQRLGLSLLIAVSISLLLLWPCARLIAKTKGAFGKTCLFVGSMLVLTAAFLALAGVLVRLESIAVLAGLGLVYLAILFAQTRHLFQASRMAAAGVLGCFAVLAAGGLFAAERLNGPMPWTAFFSKSTEEQGKMFAEWRNGKSKALAPPAPTAATTVAAANPTGPSTPPVTPPAPVAPVPAAAPLPPAPPAPTRSAPDLQALYTQLQKAKETLNPNDPEAVVRFNQQAEAYNQEKAFAAAAAAFVPKATPVKSEPGSAKASR